MLNKVKNQNIEFPMDFPTKKNLDKTTNAGSFFKTVAFFEIKKSDL